TNELIESADSVLNKLGPRDERWQTTNFLYSAYRYRIEQALAGKPHAGSLDNKLLTALGKLPPNPHGPYSTYLYAITRLRHQSRILEPQETLDPYLEHKTGNDEFLQELSRLTRIYDPVPFARKTRALYGQAANSRSPDVARLEVLSNAL